MLSKAVMIVLSTVDWLLTLLLNLASWWMFTVDLSPSLAGEVILEKTTSLVLGFGARLTLLTLVLYL